MASVNHSPARNKTTTTALLAYAEAILGVIPGVAMATPNEWAD